MIFEQSIQGMSNSVSTEGPLSYGNCSRGHHMGGENHNRLPLIIPSLSLRYILRSSIFPQENTNMKLTEN
jgi:hypothetical protein